jgi:hypothetical protein
MSFILKDKGIERLDDRKEDKNLQQTEVDKK